MDDPTTSEFEQVLAFESALDEKVCDEVREESWGRALLTPSLPLVWDLSWVEIEQEGLGVAEVVAIADEVLGGAGFAHRTVAILDEADGRRLAEELEAEPGRWPGWEAERSRYMIWREGEGTGAAPAPDTSRSHFPVHTTAKCERAAVEVRETTLMEIEGLRRRLIGEELKSEERREEVIDQLFELARRAAAAGGDRWFVAPAEGEPASGCCLFRGDGIAQVEDVGTRLDSRERGYAKAVVEAAVAAARAAGDATIFLTADAADWPQLMYARIGFEQAGDVTILRRRPGAT